MNSRENHFWLCRIVIVPSKDLSFGGGIGRSQHIFVQFSSNRKLLGNNDGPFIDPKNLPVGGAGSRIWRALGRTL
jgi:hypothetical protein